jgi:tetratricopeptide (TPR) repeat protein
MLRHHETGQLDDLEKWIHYAREALAASDGIYRHRALKALTIALENRHQILGQMADLDESIQHGEQALQQPSARSSDSSLLYHLSHALKKRYMSQHKSTDLEQAIMYAHQSLDGTDSESEKPQDRALYIRNLSSCLHQRFLKSGDLADVEISTRFARKAIETAPKGHKTRALCLHNLGSQLGDRYDRSSSTTDLKLSIQYQLEAVNEALVKDNVGPVLYYDLSIAFLRQYKSSNDGDDLEKYIQYAQKAADSSPPSSADRHKILKHLAAGYRKRYMRYGDVPDLDRCIDILRNALDTLPPNFSGRPHFVSILCFDLQKRAVKLDQTEDLFQAVFIAKEAVDAAGEVHADRAALLTSLGYAHLGVFNKLFREAELEDGISCFYTALSCSREDDPLRGERYLYLGKALLSRAGLLHQHADHVQAIKSLQEAESSIMPDTKSRITVLEALGDAYMRFPTTRLDEDAYLDKAIHQYQSILEGIAENDKQQPRYLVKLSDALSLRSGNSGHDQALAQCRAALLAIEPGDVEMRLRCLKAIGAISERKFNGTQLMSDLRETIEWRELTLELETSGTERCSLLASIGQYYAVLSEETHLDEDMRRSYQALDESFGLARLPVAQLLVGSNVVQLAVLRGLWSRAATYLDKIIPLLPDIVPPSRSRADLMSILRLFHGITSITATVYLNHGRSPVQALEALESFRGIIANLQIDAKSDNTLLKEKQPQIYKKYTECRANIARFSFVSMNPLEASNSPEDIGTYNATYQQLQQLFQELQHLRAEIQKHEGFENFLLPPRGKEITNLAEEGPLVSLSISNHGSHAFLVTPGGVEVMALLNVTESKMQGLATIFNARVYTGPRDATLIESEDENEDSDNFDISGSDRVTAALKVLWYSVVKPVLERLNLLHRTTSQERLPRIWWVGGGIVSLLPLHAAGDYAAGPMEDAPSHVVSSYVPTLKILQSIRSRPPVTKVSKARRLRIVSMPTSPGGYSSLNTAKEADSIMKTSKSVLDVATLTNPTKYAVLDALQACELVHFACHGRVDFTEPGKSSLILGKDKVEKLSVDEILDAVSHSAAEIAYLSACSTAEIHSGELRHESIHLASAFQLAGFKSVIGTLWTANDDAAVAIGSKFYELLFQNEEITGKSVAYALHDSVTHYRGLVGSADDSRYLEWTPFIHSGG